MSKPQPRLEEEQLLKLRSKRKRERERAEQALESLGPDAVDALLAVMEKEAARRRKRRFGGIALIVTYLALVIAISASGQGHLVGSFTGIIGSVGALFAATQLQKNAASALARYDDVRAVGFLAEALEFDDKDVVKQAQEALTRLLPRLRASDHELLTNEQRRMLDRALLKNRNADLSLAILTAYEQVGDLESVEVVERIASGKVRGVRDQRIIQRAAELLPALRERAELVRAAQTLLRPAESADAELLLRPAHGAPTGAAELLVRPVEDADDTCQQQPAAEEAPKENVDRAANTAGIQQDA